MRETARAAKAFADYVELGDGRSLEKLLERYQSATDSPTRRIMTLKDWSRNFGWQARLVAIADEQRQAIIKRGIADKQNRVDALNERWGLMKRVVSERAEDYELQGVAGGKTGLIVHNVKGVGKGEDFQLIDLYEVDTGLLKEMRAHEEQAAKELGQWTERKEVTGKDGGPIEHKVDANINSLSTEDLIALARGLRESDSNPDGTGGENTPE